MVSRDRFQENERWRFLIDLMKNFTNASIFLWVLALLLRCRAPHPSRPLIGAGTLPNDE